MPRSLLIALLGILLAAGLYLRGGQAQRGAALSPTAPASHARATQREEPASVELRKPERPVAVDREQAQAPAPTLDASLEESDKPVPDEPRTEQPKPRPGALWALLFEHPSGPEQYSGAQWYLGPGLTSAGLEFDNDSASAVEVPAGVALTLYVDGNGTGRRVVLPEGRHDLATLGLNDVVSSARVAAADAFDPSTPRGPKDAVQLHQHLPREGEQGSAWNLRLAPSQQSKYFRAFEGAFGDDAASAAWVPRGYRLTLFEQSNGLGKALVLGPGLHELLPYGFNDSASSARVERRPK